MTRLKDRWSTLQKIIQQCNVYMELASSMQQMKDESQQMKQILDKYCSQFVTYYKKLSDTDNEQSEIENIQQKIEVWKQFF